MDTNCDFLLPLYQGKLRLLPNGVYTPGYDESEVEKFIHGVFNTQTGAEDYSKRFSQHQYFKFHITKALSEAGVPIARDGLVLDVGSGSGNTVFPSLDIFPTARIIATDLSIYLLEILARSDRTGRVCAVQQNAEELRFRSESFDYVVGGAILHHLFRPDRAISEAIRVLRPGGTALFFEPCQNGQVLLKMAYERILLDRRADDLDEQLKVVLKRQIHYIKLRIIHRADERPDIFEKLEDKWLFSKKYLTDIIEKSGVGSLRMLAMDATKNLIESKVRSQFRLLEVTAPDWVLKVAKELDESMPLDFKMENPSGVALVIRK